MHGYVHIESHISFLKPWRPYAFRLLGSLSIFDAMSMYLESTISRISYPSSSKPNGLEYCYIGQPCFEKLDDFTHSAVAIVHVLALNSQTLSAICRLLDGFEGYRVEKADSSYVGEGKVKVPRYPQRSPAKWRSQVAFRCNIVSIRFIN